MADIAYQNPFALYQDQNPIPSNPFMSEWNATQNRATAQPFINQAKEQGDLELMKRRMETGEFTSQPAQNARMSQYPLQQQKNESATRMIQPEEDAQRTRLKEEIRALPGMTDQKIAQARVATQQAEGTPHRHLIEELGTLYDTVKDAEPNARPFLYASALKRWEMTHPGSQVPEQFRNYDERFLPDLAAIRHAQIETGDQRGKEVLENLKGNVHQKGIETQGDAARDVARIHGIYSNAAATIHANAGESTDRQKSRLRTQLRNDPNDEESRTQLRSIVENEFNNNLQKDIRYTMLAAQATSNPQAASQANVYRNQEKFRLFNSEGLYGDMPEESYTWVQKALAANPDSTVEYVMNKGKELKKVTITKKAPPAKVIEPDRGGAGASTRERIPNPEGR